MNGWDWDLGWDGIRMNMGKTNKKIKIWERERKMSN
jgi:hypothetical protein